MRAHAGDRIVVESERVAQPPRRGVVEEVMAEEPPRLRVRWDDGHTTVLAPTAGAVRIEESKKKNYKRGPAPYASSVAEPQTWHYGLIAQWWAEFNDDFRPHEIPYFQRYVERGRPALDVACGTGRLLLPYLRAGLDVDGCDVSADMIALCREKAEREGLSPTLWVQVMHELEPPRRYKTIYVCGALGLGSNREQDFEALRRFHEYLEPGGMLLLDIEVPYADVGQWPYWLKEERSSLPQAAKPPRERRRASDGSELALSSRLVEFDPLEQRVTLEMHAERWRDGKLEAEEKHVLHIDLYFRNELLLMLERAGFRDVVVEGDHNSAPATSDDDFLVFVARK